MKLLKVRFGDAGEEKLTMSQKKKMAKIFEKEINQKFPWTKEETDFVNRYYEQKGSSYRKENTDKRAYENGDRVVIWFTNNPEGKKKFKEVFKYIENVVEKKLGHETGFNPLFYPGGREFPLMNITFTIEIE